MSVLKPNRIPIEETKPYKIEYTALRTKTEVKDGFASSVSLKETVSFNTPDKKLDGRVFGISNVLAVGAENTLRHVKMTRSNLGAADFMDAAIDQIQANTNPHNVETNE